MSDYELSDLDDDVYYDEDEEMDAQDEGKPPLPHVFIYDNATQVRLTQRRKMMT